MISNIPAVAGRPLTSPPDLKNMATSACSSNSLISTVLQTIRYFYYQEQFNFSITATVSTIATTATTATFFYSLLLSFTNAISYSAYRY